MSDIFRPAGPQLIAVFNDGTERYVLGVRAPRPQSRDAAEAFVMIDGQIVVAQSRADFMFLATDHVELASCIKCRHDVRSHPGSTCTECTYAVPGQRRDCAGGHK